VKKALNFSSNVRVRTYTSENACYVSRALNY
jgi:hypothetical protein